MTTSDKIAIGHQTQHAEMLRALQGQKQAIGYMAFTLSDGSLPWNSRRRREILKALCLAAVFEGSDRSRVLVYEALRRHSRSHPQEVLGIVTSIEARFTEMGDVADVDRGKRRLSALRAALAKQSAKGAA